ncbi:MAG: hypothetical protein JWQ88_2148 [Rhodoferax sp.]|nr:hypothetical protein [Rhodoferax sp.]
MADAPGRWGGGVTTAVATIALLGTESTGKTALAAALAQALSARGHPVAVVTEWLREWCDREGRTPRPDEQQAIAVKQTERMAQAAAGLASGSAIRTAYVVADTTALMTAVYSDWLFSDQALYPDALAAQRACTHTLVTGLDLPWVADGLQRDGPQVREPIDALLRQRLGEAGLPYQVVYGRGGERLDNALRAIGLAHTDHASQPPAPTRRWVWHCDKCSDPACEHQLFSRLPRS